MWSCDVMMWVCHLVCVQTRDAVFLPWGTWSVTFFFASAMGICLENIPADPAGLKEEHTLTMEL